MLNNYFLILLIGTKHFELIFIGLVLCEELCSAHNLPSSRLPSHSKCAVAVHGLLQPDI
jgi:hypothetical protein